MIAQDRIIFGVRARRCGILRPAVLLYGEEHPCGEEIGKLYAGDLRVRGGAKLLLVAGTSLAIPGIRRMIQAYKNQSSGYIVFVNDRFPTLPKAWLSIFDVFVEGDVQVFAGRVLAEMEKSAA